MGTFYDLNAVAGTSQRNYIPADFTFLDDQDTISRLIDFENEQIVKVHFYLPQIHCSSCLWLLENLFRLNEGIKDSRVDFLKREVSITFLKEQITLRELVHLLEKIGYPPIIQLNDIDSEKRPATDKSIYYKLGLAGFAFGNIMLFSFPEYLGMADANNSGIAKYFSYLNIALILPVVFYSGWDYFKSAWLGLKQKHLNIDVPVSLGIAALFLRSVYEILSHTGAGYMDSLAGLIFFLLIGKWFQQRTYAAISFDRDYKSYFPIATRVKVDQEQKSITLDKVKKGDTLVIRHGELIPADGILLKGVAHIDYSFVTGESALVKKINGEKLFAGGRQMGTAIELTTTNRVSNSYLTKLWNDHNFDKTKKNGAASKIADKVAGVFTWAILIIAFGTLIYWLPQDTSLAINAFTAVLIIACPCAVALSIPFTFGNALRILAKQKIYLRNTSVLESLAKIDTIVFDKTGTITEGKNARVNFQGNQLEEAEKNWISSLCSNSMHPISQAINKSLSPDKLFPVNDFGESQGKGIKGKVDGHSLLVGNIAFLQDEKIKIDASASKGTFVAINGKVRGAFHLESKYRPELKSVLLQFKNWAKIFLLSGDNENEKNRLQHLFDGSKNMFFNKTPEQKLTFIKSQQSNNHQVAMIGDGLNDAGALNASEIGIVVTENSANFTPACDIILQSAQFAKLPSLFDYAKRSIKLVYVAYGIALIYNIVGLSFAVQGLLSPVIAAILMPLSSISIVIFGVGASSLIAKRMGIT